MEDSQFAAALSVELAKRIGTERFELWFRSQARLHFDARCLKVEATSIFVRECLRRQFADVIRDCWTKIAGSESSVEFEVEQHAGQSTAPPAARSPARSKPQRSLGTTHRPLNQSTIGAKPAVAAESQSSARPATPTLAAFVVGSSNEYALRAAELTARGRQQASPILFCGSTGVGKTHLLRAVQNEYRRHHPRAAAVYMTAEQFTTSFIEALRGSGLPSFRHKCRGAHMLLIDDLQFLVGKQRTLEELQHTIDTLLADGRQLVLASDRNLAELRALGAELTSRLAGGLTCQIERPEFATRLEIARQLSGELALELNDDVLHALATQVTGSARELRGAMHRLQATSQAFGKPVTRDLAEQALAELARHCTPAVRLGDVQKAVCEVFGVEPTQLRSERKGRTLSEPRMLAMWLARKYTRAPWSEIGQYFGRRSHSTVIAAHRRVERMISTQAEIGLNDRTCGVEDAIRRLETALRTA